MMRTLALLAVLGVVCAAPIPIIFDTDIGSDFDDSAAIALAISDPKYDVRGIITATGDVVARAKIVAKYLTRVNRTDIPIGIGISNTNQTNTCLYNWAADYDLNSYAGQISQDGVGLMIDLLRAGASSGEQVTVVAIAPCDNFPSLVTRAPDVIPHTRVVAMSGSIYRGYGNSSTISREYNVKLDVYGSQVMYTTKWGGGLTTTPLDTCGTIVLEGDAYTTFLTSTSLAGLNLVESYVYWSNFCERDIRGHSDVWFDTIALLLADPNAAAANLVFKVLNVVVTDDAYTRVNNTVGSPVSVAVDWLPGQQAAFELFEATTIANGKPPSM